MTVSLIGRSAPASFLREIQIALFVCLCELWIAYRALPSPARGWTRDVAADVSAAGNPETPMIRTVFVAAGDELFENIEEILADRLGGGHVKLCQ